MPRRPSSSRDALGRPAHTRTRTGCLACRERKVKCDEAAPRCRSCVVRDLACHRHVQLKWEPEFVARGLSFGREGVWTKKRDQTRLSDSTSWELSHVKQDNQARKLPVLRFRHFINSVYADLKEAYNSKIDSDNTNRKDWYLVRHERSINPLSNSSRSTWSYTSTESPLSASSPATLWPMQTPSSDTVLPISARSVATPMSLLPDLNSVHYGLLEYYIFQVCPATTPTKARMSPFASLVGPLFTQGGQESAIMAVLALAARHRSLRDSRWITVAMSLKGRALRALHHRISSLTTKGNSESQSDTQILTSIMFLCLYEIVDNCDYRWVIHLKASQNVLRKVRKNRQDWAGNNSLYTFVERFFMSQDVISRTACGEQSLFDLEYWQVLSRRNDVDEWSGCTADLSRLIFRITELSRRQESCHLSHAEIQLQANCLMDELHFIDDCSDIGSASYDSLMHRSIRLQKAAAKIYHYCLLCDASPSTPIVSELVSFIIREVKDLVNDGCVADVIFPLFTAAVELDPLKDEDEYFFCTKNGCAVSGRRAVLDILETISGFALANTQRIDKVIRKVWKMRDLSLLGRRHEQDNITTGPSRQINDWNLHVSPYCVNISLA